MRTLSVHVCAFVIISRRIILRIRNVSNKSGRQNRNTHFMFNNVFRKSSRLWDKFKKMVEPNRPQFTIYHDAEKMRFDC
jgi:hypothetical protein